MWSLSSVGLAQRKWMGVLQKPETIATKDSSSGPLASFFVSLFKALRGHRERERILLNADCLHAIFRFFLFRKKNLFMVTWQVFDCEIN